MGVRNQVNVQIRVVLCLPQVFCVRCMLVLYDTRTLGQPEGGESEEEGLHCLIEDI